MLDVPSAIRDRESQPSVPFSPKPHLMLQREAYSRLISPGDREEAKSSVCEAADWEDLAQHVFMKKLAERGLTCSEVEGKDVASFTNALLQHATGNYSQKSFSETSDIRSPFAGTSPNIPLERAVIEEILRSINRSMGTNLLVCIVSISQDLSSFTIDQIGAGDGDLVLIGYTGKGEYSSIILQDIQEESKTSSQKVEKENYRRALISFKKELNDLPNPIIYQEIINKLSNIASFLEVEGIQSVFNNIPTKTSEVLQSLSESVSSLLSSQPNKVEQLKADIMNDLKNLVRESKRRDTIWKELSVLLNLPDIRRLPSIHVKTILNLIEKEDPDELNKFLRSRALRLDIREIEDIISEEYGDLLEFLAEVCTKKPKVPEDLQSLWGKDAEFFICKKFCYSKNGANQIGFIEKCFRGKDDKSITFILHNDTKIKIEKQNNVYVATNVRESSSPLWKALDSGQLSGIKFKIRYSPDYKRDSMIDIIYPGSYRLDRYLQNDTYKRTFILSDLECHTSYHIIYNTSETNPDLQNFKIARHDRSGSVMSHRNMSFEEFKKMFLAVVKTSETGTCDPKKDITIKHKIDEKTQRLKHFKEISCKIELIRHIISTSDSEDLYDRLMDNLIQNHLTTVNLDILDRLGRSDIREDLDDICEKYSSDLDIYKIPGDILKEILMDVNYSKLIKKPKSIEVSEAMELMKKAKDNIDEIRGKDIILFIGNTGSGKSTTISYLLGAELEIQLNEVCSQIVKLKDESRTSEFPKIGQSQVESETLYATGYSLPEHYGLSPSLLLVDCPGFNDTRGGHYELCSNLSIDETIKECRSIKAIVLVIPFDAFYNDRANAVLELIKSVRGRFRNTFNSDYSSGVPNLYLIITKSDPNNRKKIIEFQKGTWFEVSRDEASGKLESLIGGDENELSEARIKFEIWQSLLDMNSDMRVDFININKSEERMTLLNKYCNSPESVDKDSYEGLMRDDSIRNKFGGSIQAYAHIWKELILTQYFEEIPNSINDWQKKIKANEEDINKTEQDMISRKEELRKQENELNELIIGSQFDVSKPETLEAIRNKILNQLKTDLKSTNSSIKEISRQLSQSNEAISKLESKKADLKQDIRYNQNIIEDLSTGDKDIVHYELNGLEIEYTGLLARLLSSPYRVYFELDKTYRLVINDDIDQFAQLTPNYKYIANAEANIFKFHKHVVMKDKIKYIFGFRQIEIKFGQDNMPVDYPYLKVTSLIPSRVFNSESINIKNSELNIQNDKLKEIESELNQELETNKSLNNRLSSLEITRDNLMNEISKNESNYTDIRDRLSKISKERQDIENDTESQNTIQRRREHNAELEQKIMKYSKKKKHMAIIIKTKLSTARMLRIFTEKVLGATSNATTETTDELSKECIQFNLKFDQYEEKLEDEVNRDLSSQL